MQALWRGVPVAPAAAAPYAPQVPVDPYALDADFYDLLHDGYGDDVGLWLSFAGRTDRPVLEVGCGTGRISVPLALAGAAVTGIDPSGAMLSRARQRADEAGASVTLLEGRAEDLDLPPGEYGFVLLPQDVFLYCEDGDGQLAVLNAMAKCLHFSGILALDLPGPASMLDPASNGQQMLVYTGPGPDGDALDVWHLHNDDLAAQVRVLRVTYERTDADGLVRRRTSEHRLRYVYRFEAEYLLRAAGLSLLDVYGDYDLGPLTDDSARMIVTARRREG